MQFPHGLLREPVDLDVPDAVVHHVARVHGVDRNLVALDVEVDELLGLPAADAHIDVRAFGALEPIHHALVADADSRHGLAVHLHDPVARHDAQLFAGATGDGGDHHDGVLHDVEPDANAFEFSIQRLISLLEVFGRDVDRVRVELLEHPADRRFHQPVQIHAVHVHAVHVVQQGVELLALLLNRFLRLSGKRACRQDGKNQEGGHAGESKGLSHARKIGGAFPRPSRDSPPNSQKKWEGSGLTLQVLPDSGKPAHP